MIRTPTLRQVRRCLVATLVAAVVLALLGAPAASAHGFLERSEPPDGGTIAEGRSDLTLWFSEPISAEARTFELHRLDGVRAAFSVSVSNSDDAGFVEIQTGTLTKTTYELDWSVISLVDGHPYSGSVLFGVGVRPEVAPATGNDLEGASGFVFRWIDLLVLLLTIGAMAVSGRVLGSMGVRGDALRHRARLIAALAAGGAVVTGAITPSLRVPRNGGSLESSFDATWALLSGTSWGRLWTAREIALGVLAVVLCSQVKGRHRSGRGRLLAFILLAAVVGLESWAGHAAALPRQPLTAAVASATHLAAAGVWAGGLVVMAQCLFPLMRRDPDSQGPSLSSAWRAFSPMAAVAAVVLVATGIYESGRHLPDLGSVFSTVYGGAVAGKVVLVAMALLLAGCNTLLINPRLAAPVGRVLGRRDGWLPVGLNRFTTVVAAEAVILMIAVGAAALLTSVSTAREIELAKLETAPHSANVDGLFVTYEVVPAGAGRSRLIVRTGETEKPGPGPITGVRVLLVDPAGATANLALDSIEPGRYEAETARLSPGSWEASVVVQRDNAADAVTVVDWTVSAADAEAARPLEVAATGLAALMLAALAAAIWFGRRRRGIPNEPLPLVRERSGSQR